MEFTRIKEEIINSDFYKEIKLFFISNKYKTLIGLIILIFIINKSIWITIDGLVTTGTLLAVLVNLYLNAKNKEKQSEIIPIYFKVKETGIKYKLKLDIPRRDIRRGEIQGLLSNFLVDSTQRYNIDSMSDLEYLHDIYKIQDNEISELIIVISEDELNGKKLNFGAFDLSKMEKIL